MGQKPGLSRNRILGQLEKEYGGGVAKKVAKWERKTVANGHADSTFLDVMSRNLRAQIPKMTGYSPT
jgi:hypothetical protein